MGEEPGERDLRGRGTVARRDLVQGSKVFYVELEELLPTFGTHLVGSVTLLFRRLPTPMGQVLG